MTDNTDLDAMFETAREAKPSPDLMARVLADADVIQEQKARALQAAPSPARLWWISAIAAMGGWSAVSGITAAGVMGLAVGLYSPDTVTVWLEGDSALGNYELAPDVGGLWTEDEDV